jgi:DNA-binding NtrC family response regulator
MPLGEPEDASELALVERQHILRVLERVRGNKKAAAEVLGISRRKLYRYLEQHGLHKPATAPKA